MSEHEVFELGGQRFILQAATELLDEEECERFGLYQRRYLAIRENYKDLVSSNKTISFSLNSDGDRVSVNELPYNIHRLKGLYLDYRGFQAQGEPTQFHRICNDVKRRFADGGVRDLVDVEISQWKGDELSSWHGYAFDDLIDTIFNAELFHTDPSKQELLRDVYDNFTSEALHMLLFYGVQQRIARIRNISFIIGSCSFNHQYVRVPVD